MVKKITIMKDKKKVKLQLTDNYKKSMILQVLIIRRMRCVHGKVGQ